MKSLALAESDVEINVHFIGNISESGYVHELRNVPGVVVNVFDPLSVLMQLEDEFPGIVDFFNSLPEGALSAQSNVLRYAVLWLFGGVYLDFDTFVLQPFGDLRGGSDFLGVEEVWKGDSRRVVGDSSVYFDSQTWHWAMSWCARRLDSQFFGGRLNLSQYLSRTDENWKVLQANNAVMGMEPQSPFLRIVLSRLSDCSLTVRYSTGPTLVNFVSLEHPELVQLLHPSEFYFVAPGESFRLFEDLKLTVPLSARVIHFVSSNHRKVVMTTRPGIRPFIREGSVVDRLIEALEADEVMNVALSNKRVSAE